MIIPPAAVLPAAVAGTAVPLPPPLPQQPRRTAQGEPGAGAGQGGDRRGGRARTGSASRRGTRESERPFRITFAWAEEHPPPRGGNPPAERWPPPPPEKR